MPALVLLGMGIVTGLILTLPQRRDPMVALESLYVRNDDGNAAGIAACIYFHGESVPQHLHDRHQSLYIDGVAGACLAAQWTVIIIKGNPVFRTGTGQPRFSTIPISPIGFMVDSGIRERLSSDDN